MFIEHIGKLIRYENHVWLLDKISNGLADLWYNGTKIVVPLDDLDLNNIIKINKKGGS